MTLTPVLTYFHAQPLPPHAKWDPRGWRHLYLRWVHSYPKHTLVILRDWDDFLSLTLYNGTTLRYDYTDPAFPQNALHDLTRVLQLSSEEIAALAAPRPTGVIPPA